MSAKVENDGRPSRVDVPCYEKRHSSGTCRVMKQPLILMIAMNGGERNEFITAGRRREAGRFQSM